MVVKSVCHSSNVMNGGCGRRRETAALHLPRQKGGGGAKAGGGAQVAAGCSRLDRSHANNAATSNRLSHLHANIDKSFPNARNITINPKEIWFLAGIVRT